MTLKTRGIKEEDVMRFELVAEGVTIGGVSSKVKDVMGEEVVGEVQHWLKFTPTFEPEIREETTDDPSLAPTLQSLYDSSTADASPTKRIVRLLVLLTIQRLPKRIRSPNRKPSSKLSSIPMVSGSCPYLERLALGDQTALAVLETIKAARVDLAGKISESPGRELLSPGTKLYLPLDTSAGIAIDHEIPNLLSLTYDQLSSKDFDKLKVALSVLAAKAKISTTLQAEVQQLRQQTASHLQARTDLQETVKETAEQLQTEANALNALMKTVTEDKIQAKEELVRERKRREELEVENDLVKGKVIKLEEELDRAKTLQARLTDSNFAIDSLKRTLSESEKRRLDLQSDLEKSQSLSSSHTDSFKSAGNEWLRQRDQLKSQVRDLESQLVGSQQEVVRTKAEIERLNGELVLSRDLKRRVEELEEENKGLGERNRGLKATLEEMETQIQTILDETKSSEARHLSEKKRLNEVLTQVESQLSSQQALNSTLTRQIAENKRNISTLEQLCCVKEDLHQVNEELIERWKQAVQEKEKITQELDYLAERTLVQSQMCMEEARLIEKYAEFCEEKEREVEVLKTQVVHYRDRNPVYTPVKEDVVDVALAEFLNDREQTLLVNFLREDASIYIFGTKRIFMKLENGKIASKFPLSPCRGRVHANRRVPGSVHAFGTRETVQYSTCGGTDEEGAGEMGEFGGGEGTHVAAESCEGAA